MARTRDPRTKEEFLDRMLSYDFDGDIRHLGVGEATIQRASANSVWVRFPTSERDYLLTIRLPRGPRAKIRLAKSPQDFITDDEFEDEVTPPTDLEPADTEGATSEMEEIVADFDEPAAEPEEDRKPATFRGSDFRDLLRRSLALSEGEAGDGSSVGEDIEAQPQLGEADVSRRRQRRAA